MANSITICRIVFSVIMLFCKVFSPAFYICYLMAGFTDMIDGAIARRLGTESVFGEKLDTTADIILFVAAAVKILPAICRGTFNYEQGDWSHAVYFPAYHRNCTDKV